MNNQPTEQESKEKNATAIISRRKLLAMMGVAGAAALSGGLTQKLDAYGLTASSSNSNSDLDVSSAASNSSQNSNPNRDADQNYYRYAEEWPERTVGDKLRESVSVYDFGALGDGVADDTAAIQAALNVAKLTDRPTKIIVPPGNYLITQRMHIYKGTYLFAHGATFIRKHPAGFLVNGDLGANYEGFDGHGNITIDGGTFEGNTTEFPQNYNALMFGRARNLVFRNLEVRDVVSAHAFDLAATENVLIENCRFLGYHPGTLDRQFSEAIQIGEHTEDGFGLFGPFDGTPNRKITVSNCYFGHSGTQGMQPWAVGIGHHAGVHDVYQSDIKIIHNTFEGMTYAGVRLMKFQDVVVSGNYFLGCRRGINISSVWGNSYSSRDRYGNQTGMPQAGKNTLITDNLFKGCAQSFIATGQVYEGILAYFENLIVANNLFEDQVNHPDRSHNVYIKWVKGLKFHNNLLKNCYRGLTLLYCKDAAINGNQIDGTVVEGLLINEDDGDLYTGKGHTANVHITENNLVNIGTTAFMIQYAQYFSLVCNKITQSGTAATPDHSAMIMTNLAEQGTVENNQIMDSSYRYGIQVADSARRVRLSYNEVRDTEHMINLQGSSNFEGFYMNDGVGKRFRVSLTEEGQFAISPD